jgi:hypothetical protein
MIQTLSLVPAKNAAFSVDQNGNAVFPDVMKLIIFCYLL